MTDHSMMKLGKLPPKHDPRTLMLAKYTSALPAAPASVTWSDKISHLGEMKNNVLGDCTCAGIGHAIQTWTAQVGDQVILPDDTIVDLYKGACGYDGTPSTDHGAR